MIFTARKAFTGESPASVKPKSALEKMYGASSLVVTVWSAPAGASLTGLTLIVIVFGVGSRSTPPFAVPPLSCTRKVKLA
ncbi:hypothetical protein D3C83_28840 [compost metagenome]